MQRSTFDLSFPYKTTFDSGWLIPLPPIEVLPGDSFKLRMTALVRLATPLHPTMDNLHLTSFWFYVPNRLLWENWQKFMGEQDNPGDSTDYLIPQLNMATDQVEEGDIGDYMGLPTGVQGLNVSALPYRAYSLIYNEWFRDENLQVSEFVGQNDGPDVYSNYRLRRRGKRKNYITSSLPWPQKGPGVEIPIGSTAPIFISNLTDGAPVNYGEGVNYTSATELRAFATGDREVQYEAAGGGKDVGDLNIFADLASATGATINDWREAFQMQKLQERDARGGTRYTEILKSHFQVISPDSRLQRPEILSTGRSPVQMNTVPQTSSTTDSSGPVDTPQGNLAAYGQGIINRHGFTKSFVEHGYIIGMINVRADLNFQQRIDRHWSRQTKYDFYWPALQALGEQPVLNKEVWADGTAQDEEVWGYQERWSEYRQNMGVMTNRMRSNATASLDPWHYALDFGTSRPALNNTFIEDNPPIERTVAVQDEPEFIMDSWIDIKAARPMPVYSVPGYIDHF